MNPELFFKKNIELRERARREGRAWLTWDEWLEWRAAAMEAGFVEAEDFRGDLNRVSSNAGLPFAHAPRGETRISGTFWHVAILRTWRRLREARERGDTAEQFHRDELAIVAARDADDQRMYQPSRRSFAPQPSANQQPQKRVS